MISRQRRPAAFAGALAAALGIVLSSTLAVQVPASAATVVKIGVDLPVSGADATNGIPTRNGVILAVEQANAKPMPGGLKFEVSSLDDAVQGVHDPAQGAQNVKTFIADAAVLGMVGPFNSNVAKAEIPLTNDAGLVQISPSNTNTGLTKGDDAKKLRTSHPDVNTYFRVCTTDDRQGAAGATFARKLNLKKAFIIDDNETYGKGLADVFESEFKKQGGSVLGHEHITKGQQDFKALLTKVHSANPDMIFFGGTTASGGGLVRKQMADVGMRDIKYVGGDGISDEEFTKETGDMANNSYYTVAAPETSKLPSAKAFVAAYKKRFNANPGPYSANSYAAAQVIIGAVLKGVKDGNGKTPTRLEVRQNVASTQNLDTPIGKIGFDRNGDTTAPILSFYSIKNGKPQFVNQINLKD
ncbi:MAG: branched-chain amino acid transport system substrate-binding protein [Candidatus Eremiobacteraeota bacterium]|jgi:branched-chain amino acid transport system substrate-binding protein|nr:branched-chain amino acid transport system substrate-binding protein [Candidatus Eremiobacteraeota bacterium]MEA2718289.1 branched-chain amino acid transport system substrate-binding protein [Candidatus Eremiobacteraeota bacterium]